MTFSMTISGDAEHLLRELAGKAGIPPELLATRLVERSLLQSQSLAAISGQIGEAFRASGMTEDELTDLLEREKHAARAERRKKAS
jgi:hypothetical protein